VSLDADIRQALVAVFNEGVARSTSWFPFPVVLAGGNYPAGMIVWSTGENLYGDTFEPTDTLLYDVELRVRAELVTAGTIMGEYLVRGSGSALVDAINIDPTLDGLVMNVTATGFDVADYEGPTVDYVARVHLQVMT
jgi:hypothetical protein